MKGESVSIEKVKNGYTLSWSWEEKDEKGETDYKSEEWIFATKEEVITKISELLI